MGEAADSRRLDRRNSPKSEVVQFVVQKVLKENDSIKCFKSLKETDSIKCFQSLKEKDSIKCSKLLN